LLLQQIQEKWSPLFRPDFAPEQSPRALSRKRYRTIFPRAESVCLQGFNLQYGDFAGVCDAGVAALQRLRLQQCRLLV
jgi:hypothetical protein